MKKTGLIITRTAFSIVLAATVAAAASGCGKSSVATPSSVEETSSSGISSAENSAPDASTSSDAEEALLFGTDDQLPVVFGSTSELSDPLPENAQEDSTVSASAPDLSDSGTTGATSAAPDLSDSGATGATSAAPDLSDSGATGATSAAPDSSDSGATGATSAVPALPGLPPVPSASTPSESEGERTAKAALKDGVPERKGKDTGLKESLLSEALVKCTGWGQSTGSSLHAAAAATQILDWSNQAGAGKADKAALFKTVETEYKRLSDEQQKNLQNNWSFISYDVETMLDSFADIEGVLSDAGCLETAKAAVADENVLENWKAAHDALEAAVNEK